MNVIKYNHHLVDVSVFKELKGKHREHCLCYANCKFFKPDTEENCHIAKVNYNVDITYNIVTPVFECPKYEKE